MDALENLAEDELAKIIPEEKLAHCRKPGVNCDQKYVDQWQTELDTASGAASSLSSFMFVMIVAVAAVINYTKCKNICKLPAADTHENLDCVADKSKLH